MESRRVLHGWKELANYIELGVRTIQRYERVSGLPVRRIDGRSRGSILAFADEVDAWLTARTQPAPAGEAQTTLLAQLQQEVWKLRAENEELHARLDGLMPKHPDTAGQRSSLSA